MAAQVMGKDWTGYFRHDTLTRLEPNRKLEGESIMFLHEHEYDMTRQ